jgi:hypothetical protein
MMTIADDLLRRMGIVDGPAQRTGCYPTVPGHRPIDREANAYADPKSPMRLSPVNSVRDTIVERAAPW